MENTDTFEEKLDDVFKLNEKKIVTSGAQPWGDIKEKTDEEVDRVYKIAKDYAEKAKGDLNRVLKRAATNNAKILIGIKPLNSFGDKVINRNRKASEIHDVLRSAILVQTPEDVQKVRKAIEKRSAIFRVEEKEKGKDKEFGYYGSVHFNIKLKGIIVEIQVMTKKLWTLKDWAHEFYNKWRSAKKTDEFKKDARLSKSIFSKGNTKAVIKSKRKEAIYESVNSAIAFATKAHEGQYRKGKVEGEKEAFVNHPIEVSKIAEKLAKKYNVDAELVKTAAILHDTVEDTDVTTAEIASKFSKEIAEIVSIVTNNKKKNYELFINDVLESGKREALVIKLADMTHNVATAEGIIRPKKIALWKSAITKIKDQLK
jgi:putative nucleotidyltransferase with HDIG domain